MVHNLRDIDHNSETILIVGAGHQQLPAINTAKRMGLRVICVDRNPFAPGAESSDYFYICDITAKEQVLEIARENNAIAVMTMQSDLPVPTVGFINSAMNLPGISEEVATACSNKNLTRERFAKDGINQPRFAPADNLMDCVSAASFVGFPCVIKPADSSGSRGVSRIATVQEVQNAYQKAKTYSTSGVVIVEEYIVGFELGAQTFSINSNCQVVCFHNDVISSGDYMMPIGHSYPFVAGSVNVEHLNKEVEKAIACLDIENGPANVDMIIPNVGKPYIIEIGARIGSNCLPELTSYHLGIDWVQYSVRSALGDSLRFPQLASNPCAAYILEAPKNGILSDVIIPGWIHSHQDVIELEITASIGDTVHTLTEGAHMVGKVIAAGSTVQSADLLAKRIRDGIVFKVE